MAKVVIMKGLPGSGKSTRAKQLLVDNKNAIRVNKDTLREMTFFSEYTPKRESVVDSAEMELVTFFLAKGKDVIIDDTNLNGRAERLRDLYTMRGISTHIVECITPMEECIERDSKRKGKANVGKNVIVNMALANGHKFNKPVVIVDIDGTLADISHRLHFVNQEKKDWKSFFANIYNDGIRWDVVAEIDATYPPQDYSRVLVSGRPDNLRKETEAWLHINWPSGPAHFIAHETLLMRRANDNRDDTVVKKEIYDKYLKHNNVVAAFDDRPRLVRMWRELGIDVHDVGNGVEF